VSRYAEPMARLIEELKKLPGVGTKSAQRFAFHILRATDDDAAALSDAVRGLKASLRLCSVCNNVTDVDPCAYCASPTRNQRLVCVVEEPTSIEAVERAKGMQGGFQGVYHVLHGTLSPLHGVGPEQLRTSTLVARVERGEIDEVILATSPTLEGRLRLTGWPRRYATHLCGSRGSRLECRRAAISIRRRGHNGAGARRATRHLDTSLSGELPQIPDITLISAFPATLAGECLRIEMTVPCAWYLRAGYRAPGLCVTGPSRPVTRLSFQLGA